MPCVKNHLSAGNDLQTVLLLSSAFLCFLSILGLASSDTLTVLILSHLVPFLPFFEVIPEIYGNLNEAKEVAKLGFWNLVGNRFYYSAFHMASALLLDKGLASCFHSGTIHLIGTQFVVKGLLDKSYGRLLSRLFELRQSGDYDDLYDATEDEVVPYIDKIFQFIQDMEKLIVFKG